MLINAQGLISRFKISGAVLARYLRNLEAGYQPNPYHNATHAADVVQTMHCLVVHGKLVSRDEPLLLMACYLAAVSAELHNYRNTNT